ncbi:MAG: M3 family oligoendopeptidase [Lachnospiraceae bacterium]|nr:M3 family oligoendopeptidase [Lachnospiraceae bacterium]
MMLRAVKCNIALNKMKGVNNIMVKFADLQYVRPDMDAVMARVKADIEVLKNAKNYEEFRNAYMDYVQADIELSTSQKIVHVRNTINMLDEYYAAENAFFNAQMPKYGIVVKEMGTVILNSPFKKDFEEEFGSIIIQNMEAQQLLSSEAVVEDLVKEADLANLYSKTVAAASIEFNGEMCTTYGLLKHMKSTDREIRKGAFEAWAALYESIAPKVDEIYSELVKIRVGMAKKLGFDGFTPMGYLKRRRFDYTPEQLEVFRKQVREVIVPVCAKLYDRRREALGIDKLYYYDESISSPEGNAVPIGDRDYMVGKAQEMYRELAPEAGEFFDFMVEYDLFDLVTKPGKRVGGYCTFLPQYHAPFIFSNFNGTYADVNVLTHEAGHAFAGFTAAKFQKIPELFHSTSEINEMHAMAMELWTYPWMESFFGEKADDYRKDHLADALMGIPYLVSVDEFQHRVYQNPDMTPMEWRAAWHEIEKEYMPWRAYDGNEFLEKGGFWMQKQHIFLYPFYYVEYAMAQIGAFEFYTQMQKDRKAAWDNYYKLCQAGGSMGYFKLLEYCNLHNVLYEGSVKEALTAVFEELGV